MIQDPLDLPFDQYQRYRVVTDLLATLRRDGERLVILDVGGRTANLRAFLPQDRVHLVDVDPSDEPGLVLGDGARLPFQDRAFDVVAAFDTLEHVPPKCRAAFVRECARVARRWIVLAGPYRADAVDQSERLLQRFLRDKLGLEHRYLDEHRHNGLPDLDASRALLESAGARTAAIGHGNLERWLPLMCLSLYLDHQPELRDLARAVFRFYNRELYASDHAAPVYRHALVGALGDAPLPRAISGLAPPVAPAGVLERFDEVVGELVGFDRARAAWTTERERLWQTVRTLEKDLEGHRVTLAAEREERAALSREVLSRERAATEERTAVERMRGHYERELAAIRSALTAAEAAHAEDRAACARFANDADRARAEIDALRADLDGHRASLGDVRAQLTAAEVELAARAARIEGLGSLLEAERAGAALRETDLAAERAASAALSADLAGHRAALRDVTADLEGHRAAVRDLRRELEAAIHERHVTEQRLEGAHGELARVAAILQDQDRRLTVLRAHLCNRLKSLRRALGPKRPPPA